MNQNAFMKVDKETFYDFVARHDDERFEYEGGYIVQQMTGGTLAHAKIVRNVMACLQRQLDRRAPRLWEVLAGRGVDTTRSVRYPDIVLEPSGADPKSLFTDRPLLIIEVLSASSTSRDLHHKPPEYMSLASLQAYLVASQDAPAVVSWVRGAEGRFPAEPTESRGLDAAIAIPALELELPLIEIFDGLGFVEP